MNSLCNFFTRLFCNHKDIRRTDGSRLYCECFKCGQTSPGINVA